MHSTEECETEIGSANVCTTTYSLCLINVAINSLAKHEMKKIVKNKNNGIQSQLTIMRKSEHDMEHHLRKQLTRNTRLVEGSSW